MARKSSKLLDSLWLWRYSTCSRISACIAGWSSLVARRAHNPKVVGSNPAPATIRILKPASAGFLLAINAGWGDCLTSCKKRFWAHPPSSHRPRSGKRPSTHQIQTAATVVISAQDPCDGHRNPADVDTSEQQAPTSLPARPLSVSQSAGAQDDACLRFHRLQCTSEHQNVRGLHQKFQQNRETTYLGSQEDTD